MERLAKKKREKYPKKIREALSRQDIDQFRRYFLDLHPQDQVGIFNSLNQEQRLYTYHSLEPKEFAELFTASDIDRKSTRLNSSHVAISYAVFCLKKTHKRQST